MKRECPRFENEGLLRLEQGLPLTGHFETCPECVRARAQYELLTNAMRTSAELPRDERWEQRVWDAIDRPQLVRSPRRRTWIAVSTAVAAAAAVAVVVQRTPPRSGSSGNHELDTFVISIQPAADSHRRGAMPSGSTAILFAHLGDSLLLNATVYEPNAELRLYRDDRELIFRCPPGCERLGNQLTGRLALSKPGRYQPYLVLSTQALPAPGSTLEADTKALLKDGARIIMGQPVQVF